ncbi:hypothetical protein E2C01_011689 [Portunus trituberculatus]|uniref:Uncharacterized protein n=1 Tax=Portunus trituberculatus TaxID=210409 RepID=A0A5B7DCM0_PORTR|nr:hypothetical protein [Portunus trituberculatus]
MTEGGQEPDSKRPAGPRTPSTRPRPVTPLEWPRKIPREQKEPLSLGAGGGGTEGGATSARRWEPVAPPALALTPRAIWETSDRCEDSSSLCSTAARV